MNNNKANHFDRSSELGVPLVIGSTILGLAATAIEMTSSIERGVETGVIATIATSALYLAARNREDR